MSRIFISHSSKNDAQALALMQWLVSINWSRADDIFLDLDPEGGIAPGEEWERALEKNAARCEAVLFLLSEAWLASKWCIDEFHLASKLNKRLFPLLLEPLDRARLPAGLTAQWQIGSLIAGRGREVEEFVASHPRLPRDTPVQFPKIGLATLRRGLEKAGLAPDSFKLTIHSTEPVTWRSPYRGLEALEEDDAAVFFGRNAEIVRCIDKMRGMQEMASSRLLVILGASGAGKSSFLRAGILPRLKRDDSSWLPLRPIRVSHGGAIGGPEGLLVALEEVCRRIGLARSRDDLRASVATPDGFLGVVAELRAAAIRYAQTEAPPLLVLSIDQAEEIFLAEAGPEAEELLSLARSGMESGQLLTLATIRSDSYTKLQDAPPLTGIYQETFSLGAVLPGEIGRIIREPALRFRRELGTLVPVFDEAVVAKLQEELHGETDALPLLGFALQRLMREHPVGGAIGLQELEQTGGVTRAIETAAEDALREVGLGDDPTLRREALRAVFVPRLARIDAVTKSVQRRVARMGDAPVQLQPILKAFINRRLLVTKGSGRDVTVEVAHEALLRRWPSLTALLDEDRVALLLLDGVLRAAREWHAAAEDARFELLVHRGSRLRYAQQLALRGEDWAQELSSAQDYLAACIARDASDEEQREASERRILIGKQRLFAAAARRLSAERRYDGAMRIALAGDVDADSIKRGVVADPIRYAELARAAHDSRLIRVVAEQPGAVTCVAFTADGQVLATGCHDGNARLYDCASGAELRVLGRHDNWINDLAMLHDGRRLITGSRDKTVRVWDLASGAELRRIDQIADEIRCVAASPAQFAAGCSDGSILIWDSETCTLRFRLAGHRSAVLGLAFNRDGTLLVSGDEDGTVQLWELQGERSIWTKKLHAAAVNDVDFSPDGRTIASAGYDQMARLTDAADGEVIRVLAGHSEPLRSCAFSPDGARLATSAGDATARIWNIETGREVLRLAGHNGWVHSVAFNPAGNTIATGGFDRTVRLWDSNARIEIARPSRTRADHRSIRIDPKGSMFAVGGADPIRLYELDTASERLRLPDQSVGAERLSFSADAGTVLAAGTDGLAHGWDTSTGRERVRLEHRGSRVLAAALSRCGTMAATAGQDGTLRLWDAATGAEVRTLSNSNDEIMDVVFSHDGVLLATAARNGTVRIVETASAVEVAMIHAHAKPVRRVVFSPDGAKIATASEEWKARVWDTKSGRRVAELAGHGDEVYDICFSDDGLRLATASRDRVTRLWDAGIHVEMATFSAPEHTHAVTFHPRGIMMAVAGKGGLIRIWDTVFLAGLSGDRLSRAVAGNRLFGCERLTDEEAAELEKFTESVNDDDRFVARRVLAHHGPAAVMPSDADSDNIGELIKIWRHHRAKAFALELGNGGES